MRLRHRNLLLGCLMMAGCQQSAQFESKSIAIPYACVCAGERTDAALVYRAIEREDRAAVLGMIAHGKAMRLEKGDQVRTVMSMEGFTRIAIESGVNIGERCWLPDRIVQ